MHTKNSFATAILASLFLLLWNLSSARAKVAAENSETPIDWSNEILYFTLIDRFCNGDSTNDAGFDAASHVKFDAKKENWQALKTYQGGDLQGLLNKLDWLDSLGITAIWLSPVFDNSNNGFMGWYPYHGYHPIDFYSVDEHFGDMELLQTFVAQAHKRGIKVILDIIYNHTAHDHPWVADSINWIQKGYQSWFHPHSGIDASTSIHNWQDQTELENFELNGLPDLAQENPAVYEYLLNMSRFWIEKTGCDGFRLDAVKHVDRDFWRKINHDVHDFAGRHFLMLGEIFSGDVLYLAAYKDLGFDLLFDIPMYYTIKRVFAQGAAVSNLSNQLAENRQHLSGVMLSTLIDNHDVARFSYWAGSHSIKKLKLALTFAWSLNGMPMIYYGTETAQPGAAPENEETGEGQDYLNRLPMDWKAAKKDTAGLVAHIRTLNAIRKSSPALKRGNLLELYKDYGVYAFVKYTQKDALIVILNNSCTKENRTIPDRGGLFKDGLVLTDMISGTQLRVTGNNLNCQLAPWAFHMFRYPLPPDSTHLASIPWQCPTDPALPGDVKKVVFELKHSSSPRSVTIAGDFNGWDATNNPMTYDSASESWRAAIPLRRGRYRYKFVINGEEWIADPTARQFELDPYGGKNSVIIVP